MSKPTTSPTGWWIAGLLEKHSGADRAPFWNNYRLVRATDWRTAFRKASEMGRNDARVDNEAFAGSHEFIGVSDLVPIYDEFEDGAEIFFEEIWPDAATPDKSPLEVFSEAEMESLYEKASETNNPADPILPDNQ